MQNIDPNHPLRRHFAAAVEHAFCEEVGLCDPELTSYLADLLVNFTHIDTLNTIRNVQGRELEQIASVLIAISDEKPTTDAERDRVVYKHIGDFTLFWAGLYPEHLRKASRQRSDVLLDYVIRGKQSYHIVSSLADQRDTYPPELFQHLSEDFESCLYGLGLVRRGWETEQSDEDQRGELLY